MDFNDLKKETKALFNCFSYVLLRDKSCLVLGFKERNDTVAVRLLCAIKILDDSDNVILERSVVWLVRNMRSPETPLSSEISFSLPNDILSLANKVCLYRVIENEKNGKSLTIFSETILVNREPA